MFVNTGKTEVIVFNHPKRSWSNVRSKHVFMYDGVPLKIVDEFKYLGVMFHATDKYRACIEHRLQQGKRLLACWMMRCKVWSFRPELVINQFNTCVLPAIEYGVGVWYAGCFIGNKSVWESVEVFWRSIARQILGVSILAPYGGVQGELEWYPFSVRAASQAIAMWTRITRMPHHTWTHKAMCAQRTLLRAGHRCWLSVIRESLCDSVEGTGI